MLQSLPSLPPITLYRLINAELHIRRPCMVFLAASPRKSYLYESRREVDVSVAENKMVSDQPANCVTEMHDNPTFFSYPSTSLHSPRGATLKGVNFTSSATPQRQKGQNSVFCSLSDFPTTIAELQPWTIINENLFKLSEARRYFTLRKLHWLEQNIIVTTNALQNTPSLNIVSSKGDRACRTNQGDSISEQYKGPNLGTSH